MRRRPGASIAANPVLVGAVTTLVVTVAVFLAYNANNGLPFVPTTQLKFQVSNGANLLPGNDVREGGSRIGVVEEMTPTRLPDGTTGAEVTMKLDKSAEAIPKDSTFNLRPRSVLGLKYVELTRGRSRETFADGDVIPLGQARYPVDLEDFYRIYDTKTRDASRTNLKGFGDAFTGRGASINTTIETLPRFLRYLEPVARSLAAPGTHLGRFFKEIGDAVRIIAPAADRYAHSFSAGADTFEGWSRYPDQLGTAIERQSRTLEAGLRSFPAQQRFLAHFRDFNGALERATDTLPRTLPRIIPALETGARVQRRAPQLNRPLRGALASMRALMEDPATGVALRGLGVTTGILNPLLRFVGPYITVCNYLNYAFTHAGEHLTEPDPTGLSQRTLLMQPPRTQNPTAPSLGSMGATTPSNGEPVLSGSPMNYHANHYSAAIDKNGNADCESGQRGYVKRASIYSPPGMDIAVDPHIPGNQGPTFTGLSRVPKGQTYTRKPTLGPQLAPELDP
jgi:ABC-type transporter Mla subunit MlaD